MLSPSRIMEVGLGFWPAKTLLSAVELGLFTKLTRNALTGRELQAAYDALPAGGALVVIENLIDDARRENFFGLGMSLNMLIEFGDALNFTAADFFGWCREVGFRKTEVIPSVGPASAGVAYK